MKLKEVPPPYDAGREDSDADNPNIWDEELWNNWLQSIDYYATDWSQDLFSTKDVIASFGHRGVRIGKKYRTDATWYYNIYMGYKIEEE
jgi:hypothetical protein